MINETTLLQSIVTILESKTSIGTGKVVLAYQNSPQPEPPYVTLVTKQLKKLGLGLQNGEVDNTGNREVVSWYNWDVRFEIFGPNSVGIAQEILLTLNLETIKVLFKDNGYNLLDAGSIMRAPQLIDNRWRDKSFFMANFLTSDKNVEFVSFIEHLRNVEEKHSKWEGDPNPLTQIFNVN